MRDIYRRLLKVSTVTQLKAMIHIYYTLGYSSTLTMGHLSKESNISRNVFLTVFDLLEVAGILKKHNCGKHGTLIEILDIENFKQIVNTIERENAFLLKH